MPDQKKMQQRDKTFTTLLKLIEKKEATEKYPALIPISEALRKKLDKINSSKWRVKHLKRSDVKKEMRSGLSKFAWRISCGVYSYCQVTGNVALRNAVKYSYSDFYRPVESTMIGRCRQVLNAVKKVKNPGHYGLFPEIIQKFQEELKRYIEFMHLPMISVKQHARTARKVENLFNQCLTIVQEQLDPLMEIISCSDENLAREYCLRRKIEKPSGRKRKYVKKKKTDQQDTVPAQPLAEKVISENAKKEKLLSKLFQ
jgi:hypothetical protein